MRARRRKGVTIALATIVVIAAATLTPSSDTYSSPGWCVVCGELGGTDLILNVLLFTPLGFGLGLAGVRPSRAVLWMCAATVGIETAQVWLAGRDASLSDVLANSAGGSVGWLLGAHATSLLWPRDAMARRLAVLWLATWLLIQTVAGYALHPISSTGTYYGRIGRATRSRPPYQGRILVAKLDQTSIPNMSFAKTAPVLEALRRGANFTTDLTVIPGAAVPWLSQIARIVDDHDDEVLLTAAKGSDFIFGTRTGAATLRLRPAYFRLADAFSVANVTPEQQLADTVHLQAAYASPRIRLSVHRQRGHMVSDMELTASSGWRLVMPFQTYIDGSFTDDLLNALWLAVLLFPFGFWTGTAFARRSTTWIVVSLGISLGLSIGPVAFGLGVSVWPEVLGAFAGAAAGIVAARALRRSARGDDYSREPGPS